MTAVAVMLNVCELDVSLPLFAKPPLSCSLRVIFAVPLAFGARVYVSVPLELMAGPELNKLGFELAVTMKSNNWPDSSAGPAKIAVAQFGIETGSVSSGTD